MMHQALGIATEAGSDVINTKAKNWFTDERDFRQLCGDALALAKGEKAEEFAGQMMLAANQHGLETYISGPQLKWLCQLADWEMPAERFRK